MKKICPICNKEFEKLPYHSKKYWENKTYCSYICYWKAKIGSHHSEETKIKIIKNNARYNKGKKFPERSSINNPQWKNRINITCKTCGKVFNVNPFRGNKAKYCSRKCKTNDNLGLTSINEKDRKSKKYKIWRKDVFEKDDYTCQKCGVRSGNSKTIVLNADHVKPFAYYPELRFEVSNGVTLCKDCHKKTETFGVNAWRTINKNLILVVGNI